MNKNKTLKPIDTVVYVSSEQMGSGDDELGTILIAVFLDTLSQFKDKISHVIFVNTGARLVVKGSKVLEQIKQLEQTGVKVLVCGTCINYLNIKDKITVGSISNMCEITEIFTKATRIIKP